MTIGETDLAVTLPADISPTRNVINARQWVIHELYNPSTYANDIALVYLPLNTYYSSNTEIGYFYMNDPTVLSIFNTFHLNQAAVVAGWGSIGYNGALATKLQYANLRIIDTTTCANTFSVPVTTKQVCAVSSSTSPLQVISGYF